jgi:hypothetical protein
LEKSPSATTNTQGQGSLDVDHGGNFFAAIKDASISTMLCHLGNMAQDAGETLQVDGKSGKVLNHSKAMQNWKRTYANGWEPKL